MNTTLMCLLGALALLSSASAADQKANGRYLAKPLTGDYYVYGGSIGDSTPPTAKDRKLSVMLTGPLAKDLFDHMGPDAKACGAAPDYRQRDRGDLSCTWSKADGYACYFGIDVRSGKSIIGITC